jgi:acyl-coenzyme A synthetase/AMP-(fatty) acid ligase
MPLIPEAIFAIFACSKIGAVHTTIFSGFNAQAVRSRLNDTGAKILITAHKKGSEEFDGNSKVIIPLKELRRFSLYSVYVGHNWQTKGNNTDPWGAL